VKGSLDLGLDVLEGDEKAEAVMSTKSTASISSFQGQGEQTSPTTPVLIPSDADLAADAAAVKNLSRWDVISVGAFRQTQQQVRQEGVGESAHIHHHHVGLGHEQLAHAHVRTPGSSTDYGNAMKKSGKFALGVALARWVEVERALGVGKVSPRLLPSNSPGTGPGAMRRLLVVG
jgi:hypothetical protein